MCNIQAEGTPPFFFNTTFLSTQTVVIQHKDITYGYFLSAPASAVDSIHRKACIYPYPWLHPPTGNTSDRRTIGKKQHKGLSTLKLSCPHSCRFSFCFPAVQSPPIRFLGDFRHFQDSPCLFPPFWLLHLLCVLYRLLHASILETQVLPQAADLLWVWCPFSFGDCTVPAYRCNPPSLGLRVFP